MYSYWLITLLFVGCKGKLLLLQSSSPSAPCLVPPAPAAAGWHGTTLTSSPPSAPTSGTAVATATATTSWAGRSASGRVRCRHPASSGLSRSRPSDAWRPRGNLLSKEPRPEGHPTPSHPTWAALSRRRAARPATPADTALAQPDTPTELGCIWGRAGLWLERGLRWPGQLPGKKPALQSHHRHRLHKAGRQPSRRCWRSSNSLGAIKPRSKRKEIGRKFPKSCVVLD